MDVTDQAIRRPLNMQYWPIRNIVRDDHWLYIGSLEPVNMVSSQLICVVILFV